MASSPDPLLQLGCASISFFPIFLMVVTRFQMDVVKDKRNTTPIRAPLIWAYVPPCSDSKLDDILLPTTGFASVASASHSPMLCMPEVVAF